MYGKEKKNLPDWNRKAGILSVDIPFYSFMILAKQQHPHLSYFSISVTNTMTRQLIKTLFDLGLTVPEV